ncbi:hypothetical protein M3P05_19905 [Sansalvadorimonas sp. 2012CJ34-2]|uniref:Transglycosylase SLT domain-containing protein n=1 Tax=Parendozoicomonas callyspongiae TaxID=2942213 RepID=A0ABT0PLE4_9GAMM|nr:hypothetical protein [Sansalvadorimonas sp. 2012CJ34-2]MCL6272189.1 hypothetical protein [Sansalvadorimonas sp. 2012CJ34-2]
MLQTFGKDERTLMGISAKELRTLVIRPTLKHLNMWSETAENLLLGTAAQESGLGEHLRLDNHRALGLYQISPRMHRNVWDNFLALEPELASKVRGLASQREFLQHPHAELATNLSYATAIALMIYLRGGRSLPEKSGASPERLGRFWHNNFHSKPQGTVADFINHYHSLVLEKETSQAR